MLWGLLGGIALTLIVHILLSRVAVKNFFFKIFTSKFDVAIDDTFDQTIRFNGIANFLTIFKFNQAIDKTRSDIDLKLDLSGTSLVDLTVMEAIEDLKLDKANYGARVNVIGLDNHISSSSNPVSLFSKVSDTSEVRTPRGLRMKKIADDNNWTYQMETNWYNSYLRNFQFFRKRPIERKFNVISGVYDDLNTVWEISDITFDEGALIAKEVFNTTVLVIVLPYSIPSFVIEKDGFFDKIFDQFRAFSGKGDIDFPEFPSFSKKFLLTGEKEDEIRSFFNETIATFFDENEIYHIESNGEALLIFQYFKPAKTEDILQMLNFSRNLLQILKL